MIVTIEGVITSKDIVKKIKNNEEVISTELLLAQTGEKVQATIRLDGDVRDQYEVFEKNIFTGQLFAWAQRDGVGMMVKVSG